MERRLSSLVLAHRGGGGVRSVDEKHGGSGGATDERQKNWSGRRRHHFMVIESIESNPIPDPAALIPFLSWQWRLWAFLLDVALFILASSE